MDNYQMMHKIGDGAFGKVYLCKRKLQTNQSDSRKIHHITKSDAQDGQYEMVAVKKMNKRYSTWDECVKLREIIALKKLNNKNLISLKEIIRENDNLYLVFEHMEQNLLDLIRSRTDQFPEQTIKHIANQILSGLSYMHRKGFFHRDIKPENILCNGLSALKIADFGLTREIDSQPPFTEYVSTRWYRAPELLLHSSNYSFTIDIWAVGCIISELYTLNPLFPGKSEIDQLFKICLAIGSVDLEKWPEGMQLSSMIKFNFPKTATTTLGNLIPACSHQGLTLIESMLKWVPKERPKANAILKTEYFKISQG